MKIKVEQRDLLGKKVKQLRAQGIVPGAVYGPSATPSNIVVDAKELKKLFKEVHYSKFFELEIEGKKPTKALIKEMQVHPVKDYVESVNFYIIDENKKIVVDVPVEIIGESAAIKANLGFLVKQLDTVSLYCLPTNLPSSIPVDISKLETAADVVTVADIELGEGVELASNMDPTTAIVYIGTSQKESAAELAEAEAAATALAESAEAAAAPAAEEEKS